MGWFHRDQKPQPPEAPAPKPRATVLLCTDNANTVTDLRAVLEAENFKIVGIVRNGGEVLEKWRALRPDIAMIDYELQKQDGLAVLQQLHEAAPEAITVFSAAFFEASAPEMVKKALQCGAGHILAKERSGNISAENVRAGLEKVMDAVLEKKAFEL